MTHSANFWWPETLNLAPLRAHDARSNPAARILITRLLQQCRLRGAQSRHREVLTNSQTGGLRTGVSHGGLMIRMAWHSGHLPGARRSRRCGWWPAALPAPEQLAGQRESSTRHVACLVVKQKYAPASMGRPDDPRAATSRWSPRVSRPALRVAALMTGRPTVSTGGGNRVAWQRQAL